MRSSATELGYLALQEVTEHTSKATATDLTPDTQYYFQLGSETEGFSDTGSFHTGAEGLTQTQFIHYTDTQNAYWNANVTNEAAYGANWIVLMHQLGLLPRAPGHRSLECSLRCCGAAGGLPEV